MSNIVINGETYEGVESISANTPDGGTATYLSETVLDTKQNKTDENLNTESKEIVGAINELKESVDNIEVPEGGGGSGILYRHYVKFTSTYEDGYIADKGTLVIPSASQTPIDNVEELRKYLGREVYVFVTPEVKGFATIEDYYGNGSLTAGIGEDITITLYSGDPNAPSVLVDNIEMPEKGTTVTVNGEAVETFNADTKVDEWAGGSYWSFRGRIKQSGNTMGTAIMSASSTPITNGLVMYNSTKQVSTEAPTSDKHCVNKKYADEKTALYQHNFYLYNKIILPDGENGEMLIENFPYNFSVISKYSQPFTLQTLIEKCTGITMFGYAGSTFESTLNAALVQAYIDGNNILQVRVYYYFEDEMVMMEHHDLLAVQDDENAKDYWVVENDIVQEIL